MVRKFFALVAVVGLGFVLLPPAVEFEPFAELSPVAAGYAERTAEEVGAANLVTAVIVTYRGLDTLGEVTVLFIATAGVGFLLRRSGAEDDEGAGSESSQSGAGAGEETPAGAGAAAERGAKAAGAAEGGSGAAGAGALRRDREMQGPSEILETGGRILIPLIVTFGIMIFLHGHVTPGGGFQGGVILASALLLYFLSREPAPTSHGLLSLVESLSGGFYVVLGLLGLVLGAGFLDNRILPLGELGELLSAGAIPLIYSLVGLKVGAELSGILDRLRGRTGEHL